MKPAREVAHAIVCERQDSEWCHWTTDRTVHAHYCDSLTTAIEARDAETAAKRDRLRKALGLAVEALEGIIPASLRDGKPFVCGECGAGIGAFPHRSHCTLGPAIEIVERALARISQLTKEGT